MPHRQPLLCALQKNNVAEVKQVVETDPVAIYTPLCDSGCEPPVLGATRRGCTTPILALLCRSGASVDDVDVHGCTALMTVASAPSTGADCNIGLDSADSAFPKDMPELPWMPLLACERRLPMTEERCCDRAACLLSFGANPMLRDRRGLTPADMAEECGRHRLAAVIKHWGDERSCKILRAHAARAAARAEPSSSMEAPPAILEMPGEIRDCIFGCLERPAL